jgi:hypothetical protein
MEDQQTIPVPNPLLEEALASSRAGLCVLPAVRTGDEKRVALASWKPFQSRRPSEEEIRSWFGSGGASGGASEGGAMCLVCGAVSGNLEMIDFDLGGEAFDAWRTAVEAAAPGLAAKLVVERTPSGGRHVVYRSMSTVSGNLKLAQRRIEADGPEPVVAGTKSYVPRQDASGAWAITVTMIETRGEGGLFLCAPSDGYAVLQGDLKEPPLVTEDERDLLLGSAWALNEVPQSVVGRSEAKHPVAGTHDAVRPGDDFNRRGDVRGLLRRHGWSCVREGENEHWCRPGKATGTSATLKDGVFYVFSSNAVPFEPQRGYSSFAVLALLEHGGDFARAASALASEGYGTPAEHRASPLGAPSAAPTLRLVGHDRDGPRILSVRRLRQQYPTLRDPVIHGLLRVGETMNVIASPKTGKSWLTIDLSLAVATGTRWLGTFETVAGDVLIIDNELHHETSSHRIPKVAEARGIPPERYEDRIDIDNLRGRLKSIDDLQEYFSSIEPGRYRLIILDAFYRFMPAGGDENDNGTMARIYNTIDGIAKRLRACFVLIHHSTKGSQSGKSVTDMGAGAGAQSRATDTHLVLRPHEENGVVVLEAAVRSFPPPEPICLRWTFPVWNVDRMLDPGLLKSDRRGQRRLAAPCEREPREVEPPEPWNAERFVEAFVTDEPLALVELQEMVTGASGLSWRRAKAFVCTAERLGLIERVKMRGRGGPVGFRRTTGPQAGAATGADPMGAESDDLASGDAEEDTQVEDAA